jgi:hypothetical protein
VYYKNDAWLTSPDQVVCTLAIVNFSRVIPLQTYGLTVGTYQYELNNKFSGMFSLQADNQLTN